MIAFYEALLGGPVKHYDFTWLRSVGPGKGTPSHVDSVYMNRGTHNLYTAWVPLGDVSFELGGLMVLAGTNNNQRLKETYGAQDVDSYCENRPDAKRWGKRWGSAGHLEGDPNQIRRAVAGPDGKWLTAEFRAGDLLTFTIFTVHASLDNSTADRIRFSSDSRYQLASDPADERWVSVGGNPPIGHADAAKRGKVC
jgi:ectoine hydroxylase-related dioxygenase (phytanoyl-CoA dioxygenase family)